MTSNKNQLAGIVTILFLLISLYTKAQSSDSLTISQMQEMGIVFSENNNVELLMSGKEKFARLFEDIRQAKQSVHLEYFNFRNDSIASLLFDILREKRKEGVEVRAAFDGFGNDSNNQPLTNYTLIALISTNLIPSDFHGSIISGHVTIGRLLSSMGISPILAE